MAGDDLLLEVVWKFVELVRLSNLGSQLLHICAVISPLLFVFQPLSLCDHAVGRNAEAKVHPLRPPNALRNMIPSWTSGCNDFRIEMP
jgi:hypothetical protein